jgi:hypothetical protein
VDGVTSKLNERLDVIRAADNVWNPKVGEEIVFRITRMTDSPFNGKDGEPIPQIDTAEYLSFTGKGKDKEFGPIQTDPMRIPPSLCKRGQEELLSITWKVGGIYWAALMEKRDTGKANPFHRWSAIDTGATGFDQLDMTKLNPTLTPTKMAKTGGGEEKKSIADKLVELGQEVVSESFTDENGTPFVAVKDGRGGVRAVLTNSETFRLMLTKAYFTKYGKAPNKESVYQAINLFEAMSLGGKRLDLAVRFTEREGKVYYDLCNDDNEVVVITASGWTIQQQTEPMFRRYPHMKPQVKPLRGGRLVLIFDHIKVPKDEGGLFLGDLVATIFAETPRTISGAFAGKGRFKSVRQKMFKVTLDPASILTQFMPKRQEDLCKILMENGVVIFDNVRYVSGAASDTLCRASTGDGVSQRELFTNEGSVIWVYKRKVLLNGIRNPLKSTDAIDRLIDFTVPKVTKRLKEKDVWAAFYADLPSILGGLFDAVSGALRNRERVETEIGDRLPRMADFTVNAEAATRSVTGFKPLDFFNQYAESRKGTNEDVLEDSLIAKVIRHQMKIMAVAAEMAHEPVVWEVTFKELKTALETVATGININWVAAKDEEHPRWPRTPKAMSDMLGEVESNLEDVGIGITRLKHTERGTLVRLTMLGAADDADDQMLLLSGELGGEEEEEEGEVTRQVAKPLSASSSSAEVPRDHREFILDEMTPKRVTMALLRTRTAARAHAVGFAHETRVISDGLGWECQACSARGSQ